MKNSILLIAIFSIFSCSEKHEEKNKSTVKKEVKKVEQTQPKSDKFTQKNAVAKLTAYGKENPETKAVIKTTYGNIYIKLYDDTPLHRASFVMLAKKGFYDSTFFYRVKKNFVIQGGNSDSEETEFKFWEIGTYRIPPEIKAHHIHKRGALALAVPENSQDGFSSPFNFYIVQGYKFTERSLKKQEEENKFSVSPNHRNIYFSEGGAPHLDGKYTVFGEVTSGFDVIDRIAEVKTNVSDFPLEDIYLSVEILE
jgi:cyclophilin family peptidyl-prolyl cis-trans isomerase